MKQTEIGLIPDDWEVKTLGDLFEMKAGGDVDKQHFSSYKSDKYTYKIFSNGLENEGIYGYTDLPKYKGDSITITGRGTVGVSMYRKEDFDAVIRLLVLNSKKRNISDNFFISEVINETVKFPNESTGVPQLTVPQIKDVLIPVPPLAEQQRIAKALSDVDALISTTEKLIQKKKNIKQGAMQNLLTGKKRLPGFGPQTKSPAYKQTELGPIPEDWEVKYLDEICEIKAPMVNPKSGKYNYLPHIGNENIEKFTGKLLAYKLVGDDALISGKYYFTSSDVLYGKINPQFSKVAYPRFEGLCSADMYPLSSKEGIIPEYLKYSLLTKAFFDYTVSISTRSGMPKVNRAEIAGYQLILPPIEEQTAIANILSSMDKEIETLNTKLEKYRNLKTAMMQQLLTGKIRLK